MVLVQSFFGVFFSLLFSFFCLGVCWGAIVVLLFTIFFVLNLDARCVFFECVQKFFIKMKIIWTNFELTRDAREALAARARRKVQKKTEKFAKNRKNHIFWTQKSPPKSVKGHQGGLFAVTPVECLRSREPPHFDFVSGGQSSHR